MNKDLRRKFKNLLKTGPYAENTEKYLKFLAATGPKTLGIMYELVVKSNKLNLSAFDYIASLDFPINDLSISRTIQIGSFYDGAENADKVSRMYLRAVINDKVVGSKEAAALFEMAENSMTHWSVDRWIMYEYAVCQNRNYLPKYLWTNNLPQTLEKIRRSINLLIKKRVNEGGPLTADNQVVIEDITKKVYEDLPSRIHLHNGVELLVDGKVKKFDFVDE